jgi:hypothetical protein
MSRKVPLEHRPQYISNLRHKLAVDAYTAKSGRTARRARALDRKFQSDCARLGLDFPVHREALSFDIEAAHARFAALPSDYSLFDADEGSPY